ncbi:MAG: hypothetical protein JW867_06250 [Candidatus Omnitrophica bacterium]|nr:hypothetical protein [Candidatus Omnitrophota bacterium]
MNKGPGSFFDYVDVDSKRLQEAFFSTASSKKTGKKKIFFIFIPVGIAIIISLFLLNFELVFIPKSSQEVSSQHDLIETNQFSSIVPINQDKDLFKKTSSSVFLLIPEADKTGVAFNFNKEQNLYANNLNLWIKNATEPLSIDVIVKDANFFSNVRLPVQVKIDSQNSGSFIKIPLPLDTNKINKVNLSRIKQIKVFFSRPDPEADDIKVITSDWRKKWLIIKDITLSKKEDI